MSGYFEEFIGVNFWTALFTLLNFLVVLFVGKKFLFGPVMRIIQDRQKEIDGLYDQAGAAKAQAEALQSEYQQKLSAAQEISERMVQEAVMRGQAREAGIIRQAKTEAAAIMDKAAADIALEKKKALNDAKDEISGLAMAIASKVVGRELTARDQQVLVDSFLDELGNQT